MGQVQLVHKALKEGPSVGGPTSRNAVRVSVSFSVSFWSIGKLKNYNIFIFKRSF